MSPPCHLSRPEPPHSLPPPPSPLSPTALPKHLQFHSPPLLAGGASRPRPSGGPVRGPGGRRGTPESGSPTAWQDRERGAMPGAQGRGPRSCGAGRVRNPTRSGRRRDPPSRALGTLRRGNSGSGQPQNFWGPPNPLRDSLGLSSPGAGALEHRGELRSPIFGGYEVQRVGRGSGCHPTSAGEHWGSLHEGSGKGWKSQVSLG